MTIEFKALIKNVKGFILISFFIYLLKQLHFTNNIEPIISLNTYRIAVVFGTRPEAIKLIPLIKELNLKKSFSCITINTGQHKEMIFQILKSFNMNISIDYNLKIMEKNQSLPKLTSKIILELENIFSLINPNAVIVQGDTTTGFAASLCAFYKKIPVFHVESGLRTHNLFSPFPEEFNRKSIDILSNLYFASTEWAANNLLKEKINPENIFVTGNTVVDSLFLTLNNTYPSENMQKLLTKALNLCQYPNNCKIILLTFHRRENYNSVSNILTAIFKLLKENRNAVVIFPFHLNPNIKLSIEKQIPDIVYDEIINNKLIKNNQYLFLNRFLLIPPLDYIDLVHLQSKSYFIMTDSGGIQEEGVSIGKPILILRNTTERPEAIESGCAILVGTSSDNIYYYANKLINEIALYNSMAKPHHVFGSGNSSKIISEIIEKYFIAHDLVYSNNFNIINKLNYSQTLSNYDKIVSLETSQKNSLILYDLIIVLTVWKRNNLEKQLIQVHRQSVLKNKNINIIVFQNSEHVNVSDIIDNWKNKILLNENITLTYIQSPIETGYFGRFIVPLISPVTNSAKFIICDDDVIWGDKYFENMLRVVDEGYLATRNGRIINKFFQSKNIAYKAYKGYHICYDEDIEFDFGGQLWAGKIDWLRKAWSHIPISLKNSEDFWISAVLKSFYNISTKIPKCPCPKNNSLIIPDYCAVSDLSAKHHMNATIGNQSSGHNLRTRLIKKIAMRYKYKRLISTKPKYVESIHKKYIYGDKKPLFNLSDSLWKGSLFWQ